MNRFDNIINSLFVENGFPNGTATTSTATNGQQNNNTNTNSQQNNNTVTNGQQNNNTATNGQQTNTSNSQQKPVVNVQKLMSDFNNNNVTIKSPKDLEQYGIKVS